MVRDRLDPARKMWSRRNRSSSSSGRHRCRSPHDTSAPHNRLTSSMMAQPTFWTMRLPRLPPPPGDRPLHPSPFGSLLQPLLRCQKAVFPQVLQHASPSPAPHHAGRAAQRRHMYERRQGRRQMMSSVELVRQLLPTAVRTMEMVARRKVGSRWQAIRAMAVRRSLRRPPALEVRHPRRSGSREARAAWHRTCASPGPNTALRRRARRAAECLARRRASAERRGE